MDRRSFIVRGAFAACIVPLATSRAGYAARLPVSTVTVEVLAVARESIDRQTAPLPGVVFERSAFVAKARIVAIPHNEHGLQPGVTIDIRYRTSVRQPPDPNFRGNIKALSPGETVTLAVFGSGQSFEWRL
jgi:hypothetical protein